MISSTQQPIILAWKFGRHAAIISRKASIAPRRSRRLHTWTISYRLSANDAGAYFRAQYRFTGTRDFYAHYRRKAYASMPTMSGQQFPAHARHGALAYAARAGA